MNKTSYTLRDSDSFVVRFVDLGAEIQVTEAHAVWSEEVASVRMSREQARQEWKKLMRSGAVRI